MVVDRDENNNIQNSTKVHYTCKVPTCQAQSYKKRYKFPCFVLKAERLKGNVRLCGAK